MKNQIEGSIAEERSKKLFRDKVPINNTFFEANHLKRDISILEELMAKYPDIAAEWHPTLNSLKPTEVTRGQNKKVYWLCSRCGNVWQDTLNHRSGGRGCRQCKKKYGSCTVSDKAEQ